MSLQEVLEFFVHGRARFVLEKEYILLFLLENKYSIGSSVKPNSSTESSEFWSIGNLPWGIGEFLESSLSEGECLESCSNFSCM